MQHYKIFKHTTLAIITMVILTVASCNTSKQDQKISTTQAREIIEKSIGYHGDINTYNQLNHFSFEKAFSLYKSDGSLEYHRTQFHDYYPSESKYHIRWKEKNNSFKNSQYTTQFSQEIDGKKNTSIDDSKIKSAIDASVFTIFLPWKLLDVGTNLTYDGEKTLADGKEVYVVKASYNPTQHKNHTRTDIWWHYFDKESYRHEGYKVALIDHTSLVRNLDFQTVNGFTFPKTRKSWRVNESNEILYLRAAYDYEVVKINF